MGFIDFLDHKCDIYHVVADNEQIGYGIKAAATYGYPASPDVKGVACHFHVRSESLSVIQEDPQTSVNGSIKLSLPLETDIRINDMIISRESGLKYRAGLPRNIRGHHISVTLKRWDNAKGAI